MAKQTVNLGTSPNKGDGDPIRTAMGKINDNFDELYAGNFADPENTAASIIPSQDGTYDIGSADKQWADLYVKDFIYIGGVRLEASAGTILIGGDVVAREDTVGSVFGDDSTLLVDGVNSVIPWSVIDGAPTIPTQISQLTGDYTGSVFADDSTLLVDGVNNSINLDGTVSGDIIPDTDVAYDLGSASNRFRDLYLSGTTIDLGGLTISATPSGGISMPLDQQSSLGLPANIGIDGFYGITQSFDGLIDINASTPIAPNADLDASIGPIFSYSKIVFNTPIAGYGGGIEYDYFNFPDVTINGNTPPTIVADIDGSGNLISLEITATGSAAGGGESLIFHPAGDPGSINGRQVSLQDASGAAPIVTSPGGTITANLNGNVTGNVTGVVTGVVTGELIGSVFGDDSTLLVDAVNGVIPYPANAGVSWDGLRPETVADALDRLASYTQDFAVSTDAHWADPDPTGITDAINRLAAAIYALNGNTGI